MESNIQIVEKPDWVSWDDIHQVLLAAHAENRRKGIVMHFSAVPGEEIRKKIEEGHGTMFVAMDNDKVIATAAVRERKTNLWCGNGLYAYLCFAAILPEYQGHGIYKKLYIYREREARKMGLDRILFDTHERNMRMLSINKKNGFRLVRYFQASSRDHNNVYMVKWLDGCPFSKLHCWLKFQESKIKTILQNKVLHR